MPGREASQSGGFRFRSRRSIQSVDDQLRAAHLTEIEPREVALGRPFQLELQMVAAWGADSSAILGFSACRSRFHL
jgi:hypothetical protein